MGKMRILVVDNNAAFLKTRKWALETAGYEVLCATSLHKARQILNNTWVHLAVVDLRLSGNDTDASDIGGLVLLRETDAVIPKIILTAFPDWHFVRTALNWVGAPAPAVDFLAKQDGPEVMLRSIEHVLREQVRINESLGMVFGDRASFFHLVAHLNRERLAPEVVSGHACEMEDLFRKVFYEHTCIYLHSVSVNGEGVVTVLVKAVSNRGAEYFAVKCGCRRDISASIQQTAVRHVYHAETLHYGAVVYHMTGWQRLIDACPHLGKFAEFLGNVISLLAKASGG